MLHVNVINPPERIEDARKSQNSHINSIKSHLNWANPHIISRKAHVSETILHIISINSHVNGINPHVTMINSHLINKFSPIQRLSAQIAYPYAHNFTLSARITHPYAQNLTRSARITNSSAHITIPFPTPNLPCSKILSPTLPRSIPNAKKAAAHATALLVLSYSVGFDGFYFLLELVPDLIEQQFFIIC